MFNPKDMTPDDFVQIGKILHRIMEEDSDDKAVTNVPIGIVSPKLLKKFRKWDAWSDRLLDKIKATHAKLQLKMNRMTKKVHAKIDKGQRRIWDEIHHELKFEGEPGKYSINAVTGQVCHIVPIKGSVADTVDDFPGMIRKFKQDDDILN